MCYMYTYFALTDLSLQVPKFLMYIQDGHKTKLCTHKKLITGPDNPTVYGQLFRAAWNTNVPKENHNDCGSENSFIHDVI